MTGTNGRRHHQERSEIFPPAATPAEEIVVDFFSKMVGWREYMTPVQCTRIADGLRRLAVEFERPDG